MTLRTLMLFALGGLFALSNPAQATDPQVLRNANGQWATDVKSQHFCDQQNTCHDLVFTTDTNELIFIDGAITTAFVETGNGQEIIRNPNPPQ